MSLLRERQERSEFRFGTQAVAGASSSIPKTYTVCLADTRDVRCGA